VDPTTLSSKAGVMLYFSAHWCPPCRGFTPQLATYYNTYKDKFNFEIVFVSSDKEDHAFNEYWGEMPWLALPYVNRAQKDTLSKKYKVSGIPTLVVLNNKAETITTGGRGKVTQDPEGFPWAPKSFLELITGDFINKNNETISSDTLKSNTALGIYFSAHWCPPCRGFTPQLVNTYNTLKAAGKKFEIIFASSDHDQKSFKEYMDEMPWLAFPFGDGRITAFNDLYDVEGIPMLVIVDSNGKIINKSGRGAVSADPQGENFPWAPKPLNSIESAGSDLNDKVCFVYIEKDISEGTKAALNNVAKSYTEKWKKRRER
jgi:nucleoredoxin